MRSCFRQKRNRIFMLSLVVATMIYVMHAMIIALKLLMIIIIVKFCESIDRYTTKSSYWWLRMAGGTSANNVIFCMHYESCNHIQFHNHMKWIVDWNNFGCDSGSMNRKKMVSQLVISMTSRESPQVTRKWQGPALRFRYADGSNREQQ